MELRHIRYFIAIAQEKNFTKAAERLGIGQPPLSMQIKDLENEVGTPLFIRGRQGATLTEAGYAFYEAVSHIPEQTKAACQSALRFAQGVSGSLTLGFTGTSGFHPLIPAIISAYRRQYPGIELHISEANSLELYTRLRKHQMDIALLRPLANQYTDLSFIDLLRENLIAALPCNHPLAKCDEIDLISLSEEPFILTPKQSGQSLHEAVWGACQRAGFDPKKGTLAPHIVSILSLVAAEAGVSLLPESMANLNVSGVRFVRLKNCSATIGLAVVWHYTHQSITARNFLQVAQAVTASTVTDE